MIFVQIILEFVEKYIFIPGVIENNILIFDCLGLSVFTAPYDMLKYVLGILQILYK
jgi:hypothetical protein